jgi:hypothetical protein
MREAQTGWTCWLNLPVPAWLAPTLALTLVLSGPAAAAPGDALQVNGSNVNVRTGPTTEAAVARKVQSGQRVIERRRRERWIEIEVVDALRSIGWIHDSLLEPADPVIAEAPVPVERGQLRAMRHNVIRRAALPTPADRIDRLKGEQRAGQLPSARIESGVIEPGSIEPGAGHPRSTARHVFPIAASGAGAPGSELLLSGRTPATLIDADAMRVFQECVAYLNRRAEAVAGIQLFNGIEAIGGGVVQVVTTTDWGGVPPAGQQSYLNTLVDRWATANPDGGPASVMLVNKGGDILMHKTRQ